MPTCLACGHPVAADDPRPRCLECGHVNRGPFSDAERRSVGRARWICLLAFLLLPIPRHAAYAKLLATALAVAAVWHWGWDHHSCVPSRHRRAALRLAFAGGMFAGLSIPAAWQFVGLATPGLLAGATLGQRLLLLYPASTLACGALAAGIAALLLQPRQVGQ